MICHALKFRQIIPFFNSFDDRALEHGARAINEPKLRPGVHASSSDLCSMHEGKDASIESLLAGGNGFTQHFGYNSYFDIGMTEEKRDMRSMQHWQESFYNCEFDRRRGATA
jgi:hypothetical protein